MQLLLMKMRTKQVAKIQVDLWDLKCLKTKWILNIMVEKQQRLPI